MGKTANLQNARKPPKLRESDVNTILYCEYRAGKK